MTSLRPSRRRRTLDASSAYPLGHVSIAFACCSLTWRVTLAVHRPTDLDRPRRAACPRCGRLVAGRRGVFVGSET
jgi:hypothetical protein